MIPVDVGGCLGWIHPGGSARGAVLCGALDYEGLCTYRAWWGLTGRIAAAGCPALRFDYPGSGDSLDAGRVERDAGRGEDLVERAVAAARGAIERLKAVAGVEEVVLVGLRFGALVAALAAEGRSDVAGLALLAPVASGRAFAREMTIQSKLLAAGLPAAEPGAGLAVAGFVLSEPALAGLRRAEIGSLAGVAAPRILLAEPKDRADKALAARLAAQGAAFERQELEGYEALMQSPTLAREPAAAWAGIAAWVAAEPPSRRAAPLTPPPAVRLAGEGFAESPVQFGPGRGLAGVLCRPAARRPGAPFVVFANSGRNPRFGWARSTTALARRLAGEGVASLRFDMSGIGDSRSMPDGDEPLYSHQARADMAAALDMLVGQGEAGFLLFGSCSGAHLVFHAAVADPRVAAVVSVNLQRFIWPRDASLQVAMRRSLKPTAFYRRSLFRRETWKRLLAGEIDVASIGLGLFQRKVARPAARLAGAVGGRLGLDTPAGRVRRWLLALERRGVRVLLVHTEGDPGLDDLVHHFGTDTAWLVQRRGLQRAMIADSDHDLTPARAREDLWQILTRFLGVAPELHAQGEWGRASVGRDGNAEGKSVTPGSPPLAGRGKGLGVHQD
ncbi:hypothetical protein [Labrys wisconsinensis]|uniref:Dienelactone hydrolase n=1 Tax=Labrys wisconsinensis TaxID=425677 RepID=A0ABU0J1T0_9HYPH|nr:hypothetical protein [Labrys wisconsinensis]MDQ0467279.1 dienelactone hydrolase [Labrys wisconsinensis]